MDIIRRSVTTDLEDQSVLKQYMYINAVSIGAAAIGLSPTNVYDSKL